MKTKSSAPKHLPSGPELDRLLRPADTTPPPAPAKLGAVRKTLTRLLESDLEPRAADALRKARETDRAKLHTLVARPAASRRELARADKASRAELASRIAGLQSLVAAPHAAGRPEYHLLDKPYLIWSDTDLQDSAVVPVGSRAKLVRRSEDGGPNETVSVRFHYWWRNQRDSAAVINVNAYAIFRGRWTYGVGSGFFWGDRWVSANVRGMLQIVEWWKQPATSVPFQSAQSAVVLDFHVDEGGFGSVGAVDQQVLLRGVDLSYANLIVPAQEVALFTVTAFVAARTGEDDSLVALDFADDVFQIGSPAVLVTVL